MNETFGGKSSGFIRSVQGKFVQKRSILSLPSLNVCHKYCSSGKMMRCLIYLTFNLINNIIILAKFLFNRILYAMTLLFKTS